MSSPAPLNSTTPKREIQCPHCGSPATRVTKTQKAAGYVRRSRQCDHCGKAFCTHEVRAVYGQAHPARHPQAGCKSERGSARLGLAGRGVAGPGRARAPIREQR